RNVHFRQPFDRYVAAAARVILPHVARDVGELESQTEIAGAIERFPVIPDHAHDLRHYDADRARDMVVVSYQVFFGARASAFGIERETFDHVFGHLFGEAGFARHLPEGIERHIRRGLAIERAAGEHADAGDARLGLFLGVQ